MMPASCNTRWRRASIQCCDESCENTRDDAEILCHEYYDAGMLNNDSRAYSNTGLWVRNYIPQSIYMLVETDQRPGSEGSPYETSGHTNQDALLLHIRTGCGSAKMHTGMSILRRFSINYLYLLTVLDFQFELSLAILCEIY